MIKSSLPLLEDRRVISRSWYKTSKTAAPICHTSCFGFTVLLPNDLATKKVMRYGVWARFNEWPEQKYLKIKVLWLVEFLFSQLCNGMYDIAKTFKAVRIYVRSLPFECGTG